MKIRIGDDYIRTTKHKLPKQNTLNGYNRRRAKSTTLPYF